MGTENSLNYMNCEKISTNSSTHRVQWNLSTLLLLNDEVIGGRDWYESWKIFYVSFPYHSLWWWCESIISSRPLLYCNGDSTELSPVTPVMFLHEIGFVDVDATDWENIWNIHFSWKKNYDVDLVSNIWLQRLQRKEKCRYQSTRYCFNQSTQYDASRLAGSLRRGTNSRALFVLFDWKQPI